ncbi:hypothetical protein ACPYO6_04790 [Georgenia sp. Z1344]|uniref:hypothetical protein n=1 Tax=Georgenia sp. Z1344 TaxID=3416706 RepID=UPI003CF6EB3B
MRDTTVAVLGDGGRAELVIADALADRGARPHLLSVDLGWLTSVRAAVARLDSHAGAVAVRSLAEGDVEGARLVAVGPVAADEDGWETVCRRCGERNDVTLVRTTAPPPDADRRHPVHPAFAALAEAVADELDRVGPGARVVELPPPPGP